MEWTAHKCPEGSTKSKSIEFTGEHLALNKKGEVLDNNLKRSNLRILSPAEHSAVIESPGSVEIKLNLYWSQILYLF